MTLAVWIFSLYAWNIAKWGHIELEPVDPTTRLWPFVAIVGVVLLAISRQRAT